ncbi:MAG: isocitrate lyase/phosphoenolpyruvate mutase family protein [Granulosicoccus sp.]
MNSNQFELAKEFLSLHQRDGIFIMPNAWSVGSACLLEDAGFKAIATTSAGIAFDAGLPDYTGALNREDALAVTAQITSAIELPVSADAENGYGHTPEAVAETIRLCADTGCVGAGIEDYSSDKSMGLYDIDLAAERIQAARKAADSLAFPFTLTARAECFLTGHADAFTESVKRANRYAEAGADCLFVPGLQDIGQIGAFVRAVNSPVSVVMGLSGAAVSVKQLEDVGVRRVSVGGSLARATLGLVRRAANELMQKGTFSYADGQIPDDELSAMFTRRLGG